MMILPRRSLILAIAIALLGSPAVAGATERAGSIHSTAARVPGSYIVTLAPGTGNVASMAADLAGRYDGSLGYIYRFALRGFSVRMNEQAALALSKNPRVASVEQDGVVTADDTQISPTWGLDRIDQRSLPLDQAYTYNATGSGVTAYVIDSGIRISHSEFGTRASYGFDVDGSLPADDCYGHGTHVAGTIGGSTYGVAKGVNLVAVRVLDCAGSGTWSGIIAGVDWVTGDHDPGEPAVANMSLGGGANSSLETAVRNSIADGIVYATSAGNTNSSACDHSPGGRVSEALTVGATDQNDVKASFSNYGECIDLFAPGVGITSAWITDDTSIRTISGTSMAAPHVAGVAALQLEMVPTATPKKVSYAVTSNATSGVVQNAGSGSPNLLLYSGFVGTPQPNSLPVASFTSSCSGLVCDFSDTSTDLDGEISSRSWDFGDGNSGSGAIVSHTYAAGGTYSVVLAVTDDSGGTGTVSKSVTVTPWNLTVSGKKVKGVNYAYLTWNAAATSASGVDVYRNGSFRMATNTGNTGSYVDSYLKSGRSYTYKVCPTGSPSDSTRCSNVATVRF